MDGVLSGALIGLLGGSGLGLVHWSVCRRRIGLVERLAPYLRVPGRRSSLLAPEPTHTPFPTLERMITPILADLGAILGRAADSSATLRRRLAHAGGPSPEQYRAQQALSALAGLAASFALALLLALTRGTALPVLVLIVALGTLGGVVARDRCLTARIHRRNTEIMCELPTIAEMLALAVSAGEGVLGALDRVSRTTDGAVACEIRRVLAEVRSGIGVTRALENLADRTGVPALARLCEATATAVERGTPLADVLRAQAQDVRAAGRRDLIESGSRKEVAQMIPVIFLIMPVTVVFAVFPSLATLSMTV